MGGGFKLFTIVYKGNVEEFIYLLMSMKRIRRQTSSKAKEEVFPFVSVIKLNISQG